MAGLILSTNFIWVRERDISRARALAAFEVVDLDHRRVHKVLASRLP